MSKDPNQYTCRCCVHANVPFTERGPGFPYYPFYGGYLCKKCRDNLLGPHTDHPLRHWDRTCPACNPAIWREREVSN